MEYGIILAIISPLISSIAVIFQSGAVKLLNPLAVAGFGALLGSAALFSLIILSREKIDLKKIKTNYKDLLMVTLLRPLTTSVIFAYGLAMTAGIKAIFFTKVEPYFVLFWHWLLKKEKVSRKHMMMLAIHIIGAIILSTGGTLEFGVPQIGDLLIVLAVGLGSFAYINASRASAKVGSKLSNAISMGIAGLILAPLALVLVPFESPSIEPRGWLYLGAYVVLFNIIGLTMWFSSLKTVKGWIVSALRSIGPLAGLPFAWLVFGETLTAVQLVGGVIVVVTSALIAREHLIAENSKRKKEG